MKRFASSIIWCLLILLCACESTNDNYHYDSDGQHTLLVNLDISVALADVSDVLTRAIGNT